jgi:hypothetical protein
VSYDRQSLQQRAYEELNEFVGELRADLDERDELVLVSDHGLQDGLHTETAMIASTTSEILEQTDTVVDVRGAIETELDRFDHTPTKRSTESAGLADSDDVREQLKDLGYI